MPVALSNVDDDAYWAAVFNSRNNPLINGHNAARVQTAAQRTVARAREALSSHCHGIPPLQRKALLLRVGYPTLSLAELAELAGMTKDQINGQIRRGLQIAERLPKPG